ncbi:hypothetical protein ACIRPU_39530 [Streptomyces sp. NPDC102259]|uniref:ATP-dependent DNA ligase n=1 Tax=Streptomyces sp. NPDC102259 TaxID=3366148 RepID=UPI0037F6E3CF
MAPDSIPRTVQQRITEVGRISGSRLRRRRPGSAALQARHRMGPSFPEVVAGAVQLPDATSLDGELVVWDAAGRLAFERLQNRLARRGAGAARAAQEWPAHFVAFDLLRLSGTDTIGGAGPRWSPCSPPVGCRRRRPCARRPPRPTSCAIG